MPVRIAYWADDTCRRAVLWVLAKGESERFEVMKAAWQRRREKLPARGGTRDRAGREVGIETAWT